MLLDGVFTLHEKLIKHNFIFQVVEIMVGSGATLSFCINILQSYREKSIMEEAQRQICTPTAATKLFKMQNGLVS